MELYDDWVDVDENPSNDVELCAQAEHPLQEEPASVFEVVHRNVKTDTNPFRGSNLEAAQQRIPGRDLTELYNSIKDAGALMMTKKQPLFTIGKKNNITEGFFSSLDDMYRKEMDCSCCKRFIKQYGQLAIVDLETGELLPVFWKAQSLKKTNVFRKSVSFCESTFSNKEAQREFKVSKRLQNAGVEYAGGFKHMHFTFPSSCVQEKTHAKWFAPAQTEELAAMLDQVMKEFEPEIVNYAAKLVLEDKLPYASEHKASIGWLKELWDYNRINRAQTDLLRHNLLHHYAATSFVGCIKQLRSGALSTLLTNVKDHKTWKEIQASWMALTNPTQYMRPQAAPSVGNINAAEKHFENLGITADDLRRKFAVMEDIPQNAILYKASTANHKAQTGVFSGLVPAAKEHEAARRTKSEGNSSGRLISFSTFVHHILPKARSVEFNLPESCSIYFFITGLLGSKPLMQWQSEQNRVSWYTFASAIKFPAYGLKSGWNKVGSIVGFPHLWSDMPTEAGKRIPIDEDEVKRYTHRRHGIKYLIQLQEIADGSTTGLSLFPTFLKSEFHGARSTIEAFSQKGKIEPGMNFRGDRKSFFGGVALTTSYFTREKGRSKFCFRILDKNGNTQVFRIDSFS